MINLIILIILIFAMIISFIFLKKLFKIFFYIFILFIIFNIIISAAVFFDLKNLKDRWQDSDKIVVFVANNTLEFAMKSKFTTSEEPVVLNLSYYRQLWQEKKFKEMLNDSLLMFIFHPKTFSEINKTEIGNVTYTREELINIIESDNAKETFINIYMKKLNLEEPFKAELEKQITDEQARMYVFIALFNEKYKDNPSLIFVDFLEKKLEIYPERIAFKLIKYIPESLTKKILKFKKLA